MTPVIDALLMVGVIYAILLAIWLTVAFLGD